MYILCASNTYPEGTLQTGRDICSLRFQSKINLRIRAVRHGMRMRSPGYLVLAPVSVEGPKVNQRRPRQREPTLIALTLSLDKLSE